MKNAKSTDYQVDALIKISGQELEETKKRMIQFWTRVMESEYQEGEYPRWADTVDQLIENAWFIWKWQVFTDKETGRPMTLKKIATRFCYILHRRLPGNIYGVAYQSLHSGRMSVVDYYAMLWREDHLTPKILVFTEKPICFPFKIKSYRGLFD